MKWELSNGRLTGLVALLTGKTKIKIRLPCGDASRLDVRKWKSKPCGATAAPKALFTLVLSSDVFIAWFSKAYRVHRSNSTHYRQHWESAQLSKWLHEWTAHGAASALLILEAPPTSCYLFPLPLCLSASRLVRKKSENESQVLSNVSPLQCVSNHRVLWYFSALHLCTCTSLSFTVAQLMLMFLLQKFFIMSVPLVQICMWLDKYTFCSIAVFTVKVIVENFGSFYQLLWRCWWVTLIRC